MKKFKKKDFNWFTENDYSNPNDVEYENIYFTEGDVSLTSSEFEKLMLKDDPTVMVVEGNLTIDGHLFISDFFAVIVTGDVFCTSFSANDDGYLECETIHVLKYAKLSVSQINVLDVAKMIAPLVFSPYDDAEEFIRKLDAKFVIDNDDDDRFEDLRNNFDEIYSELKSKK
jgi:hypothetical protein